MIHFTILLPLLMLNKTLDFDNFWKYMSVHPSIHSKKMSSASLFGLPANSHLKCDQFNCCDGPGCVHGTAFYTGNASGTTSCIWGRTGGSVVLVVLHQPFYLFLNEGMNYFFSFFFDYPKYYYSLFLPIWH